MKLKKIVENITENGKVDRGAFLKEVAKFNEYGKAITESDHLITATQVSKMHGDAKDEDKELVAAANKLIAKLLPKYDIEDILAYIKHTVMLDTKQ